MKDKMFTIILVTYLRKKRVMCRIWSVSVRGAEIGAVWTVGQKYLESIVTSCWRRTEKISWNGSM